MGTPIMRPTPATRFLSSSQEISSEPQAGQRGCSYSPTPLHIEALLSMLIKDFHRLVRVTFSYHQSHTAHKLDQSQSMRTTVSSYR